MIIPDSKFEDLFRFECSAIDYPFEKVQSAFEQYLKKENKRLNPAIEALKEIALVVAEVIKGDKTFTDSEKINFLEKIKKRYSII